MKWKTNYTSDQYPENMVKEKEGKYIKIKALSYFNTFISNPKKRKITRCPLCGAPNIVTSGRLYLHPSYFLPLYYHHLSYNTTYYFAGYINTVWTKYAYESNQRILTTIKIRNYLFYITNIISNYSSDIVIERKYWFILTKNRL